MSRSWTLAKRAHEVEALLPVRATKLLSVLISTLVLATPAVTRAQTLRGIAFDSLVTRRPLAGAEVWSPTLGRTVTTDAAGRFVFDSATAAGRDTIELSLHHPLLARMALPDPHVKVPVAAIGGDPIAAGVPSAETLRRLTCRTAADSDGVLVVGRISGSATPGAVRVAAFWEELATAGTTVERQPRSAAAEIRGTTFWLCSAPVATPFVVIAQDGVGPATIVRVGATQEPFVVRHVSVVTVADSTSGPSNGRWALTGRVVSRLGEPIGNAEVTIGEAGDGRARTNADGRFGIALAVSGRREVHVRAVGYEPMVFSTYLTPRQAVLPDFIIEHTVQVLAERNVTASTLGLRGFEYRRRTGQGYYLTREQIEKRKALTAAQLFTGIPSVWVQQSGTVAIRRTEGQIGLKFPGGCLPVYYVDGVPREIPMPQFSGIMPPDLGPNNFVTPNEIEAVEVYKGLGSIPVEFKKLDAGCGVIVIWTRRGLDAREQAPRP